MKRHAYWTLNGLDRGEKWALVLNRQEGSNRKTAARCKVRGELPPRAGTRDKGPGTRVGGQGMRTAWRKEASLQPRGANNSVFALEVQRGKARQHAKPPDYLGTLPYKHLL